MHEPRYEIGWHSNSIVHCHVALVSPDGDRDELFDVALYHFNPVENDADRIESLSQLELLVSRANEGLREEIREAKAERYIALREEEW
jgi:hypothetical protein